MKKLFISTILIVSLVITSCTATNGTTPTEVVETTTVTTTTEATTTTTEATTTQAKQAISSIATACDLASSALGKDLDTACAIIEDGLGTSFTLNSSKHFEAGVDYNDEERYEDAYSCDIVLDGKVFKYITFSRDKDKKVYTINFTYNYTNSSDLKECYEFLKAALSSITSDQGNENNLYDSAYWTSYGPINGVVYEAWYLDYGHDENHNHTLLTICYEY